MSNFCMIPKRSRRNGAIVMSWLKRFLSSDPLPGAKASNPIPAQPAREDPGMAWLREHEARTGNSERPKQAPAWAILLRSPWEDWSTATSWFGGLPVVPPGFLWPRSPDGTLLHFLAQIDLAAFSPHPTTGDRPKGLPDTGALLIFVGLTAYTVVTLTTFEMAGAQPLDTPDDLPPLTTIHHWQNAPTFVRWPVVLHPFIDDGTSWPAAFPRPFIEPTQWITTWGMARYEADHVLQSLDWTLSTGKSHVGKTFPPGSAGAKQTAFMNAIAGPDFQEVFTVLRQWRDTAGGVDPTAPVDRQALHGLFALRKRVVEGHGNYPLILALKGYPQGIWKKLRSTLLGALAAQDVTTVPPGLRSFVETNLTTWRGHRLFGLLEDLEFNEEDRRGQDLLVSIQRDDVVRTEREHHWGTSIWVPRAELAAGQFNGGQLLQHGTG
jgi:hypothetical protein